MKTKLLVPSAVGLLVLGLVTLGAAGFLEKDEEKVSIDQVPAAIKTALKDLKDMNVREIESEVEDGETVYEVETVVGGEVVEFEFDADGNLLSVEAEDEEEAEVGAAGSLDKDDEEASIDQLPAPIKKALKEMNVREMESEVEDGETVYEVETVVGGEVVEFEFDADGNLLSVEVEDEEEDDEDDDD